MRGGDLSRDLKQMAEAFIRVSRGGTFPAQGSGSRVCQAQGRGAVAGGVRARACGAGQAGAGASERLAGWLPGQCPPGRSPDHRQDLPTGLPRSGLHLRGPQGAEEGAGDAGAVEQPAHAHGHGLSGHDAGESAGEGWGGSAVRSGTSPTPGSHHLPAVAAPSVAHPASSGTCSLPPALFGLCFSFCTLFPLRKVALLSLSLCIQHHSPVQRFVRGENVLHRKLAFLEAISKS